MAKLVLVPTPIGNLEDITFRAVRILKEVSFILAEDTRTSYRLLSHYAISTPMQSYHIFNEHKQIERLISKIEASGYVALISDAGTPGISDPGFLLVRECLNAGIEVECLPGPTAMIPAIVASGLPNDRFIFEGFLPHKKGRKKRIERLQDEDRTIVFYESPHRIVKTLDQLAEVLGNERQASISREISKIHEEIVQGSLSELSTHFQAHAPKGEFVLVVRGVGKGKH
ncbi:MAG: 16S rRNA (cytidine(1402)-2'-O)-methyltransferase [Bacteroidota bacterium]|nr:16S rRNA (cytidine(1402)-2'-O)-methyltransferase [Bacteroidota bacterium]